MKRTPVKQKTIKKRFFEAEASAIAPKKGEKIAEITMLSEIVKVKKEAP